MKLELDQVIDLLSRTPAVLRALLWEVSDPWVFNNYGEKTFNAFDVVGHLIHGELADWLPRAGIILEHGESQPFETFDRYAMFEASKGKTMGDLLGTFESLRRESIEKLKALDLSEEQLALRGTHPQLGAVTLGELLAMWVVHDLNHIAQISKAMAFQYRDNVGPWLPHASILKR